MMVLCSAGGIKAKSNRTLALKSSGKREEFKTDTGWRLEKASGKVHRPAAGSEAPLNR